MRTLTIRIEPDTMDALERAGRQFTVAWQSGAYAGEYLSFESPSALFRLLTPARWGVLEALQKAGHCGLRELARQLGRDASAVHRDIVVLAERELVEKDESGKLFVPFGRIHAEIDLMPAYSAACCRRHQSDDGLRASSPGEACGNRLPPAGGH